MIKKPRWHIHCIPFLVIIIVVGTIWPYTAYSEYWSKWVMKAIYLQWFIYLATSFKFIKPILKNYKALKGLSRTDLWCLSVYFGITFIWLAYIFGAYTSYIVGAISFTFILYIIGLLLALNVSKTLLFFKQKEKYNNKTITQEKAREIENSISILIDKELFLKPNITLSEFASGIKITKHTLSQYLNEQKGKSFNRFINELRVEKAKEYLVVKHNYTMESIGYDSGFNSKSTFFKAFKKVTGLTPLEYQKRNAR
ncbi:AraC family transcriptional regulator [Flavobacterium sp. ASW18X]|uniref:helix-turn-helix domain-containing protein n=1 Tax=Flavobacterium sp. ASW18X TaxID=2572595 RepID=UPI00146ABB82|nr:helix-turn-helix domain-containing protein [Flavobacterium sp. ASW18X]